MRKVPVIIAVVLLVNVIIIGANVSSGISKGDMMLRFQERQAVTFLSALMLGLTSLTSLIIYQLKKRSGYKSKGRRFWLFTAIGFLYLCMDEYFMAHEGMDGAVAALFGKDLGDTNLDNMVIAFFGLIALTVCLKFRKEIFKHKELLPFLALGALGLAGTVIFHAFERVALVWEVVEESFKIVGVSFFFAGFLTVLLTYIGNLSISETNSGR